MNRRQFFKTISLFGVGFFLTPKWILNLFKKKSEWREVPLDLYNKKGIAIGKIYGRPAKWEFGEADKLVYEQWSKTWLKEAKRKSKFHRLWNQ